MKWKVELYNDLNLLKTLSTGNGTVELFDIYEEDEHFYLTSRNFENLFSADEVKHLSAEIIEMINGTAFYLYSKVGMIKTNAVFMRNESGSFDIFIYPESINLSISTGPISFIIENRDGTIIRSSPLTTLQNLLKGTERNPTLAKIFRLLAKGNLDWTSLYRLYEVIYSDVNDQMYSWIDKSKAKLFKHTCNSMGAIGDDARHGKETSRPPKNPMKLTEAQDFVKSIIDKYLFSQPIEI